MKYLRSHRDTQVHKYDFVSEPLVQRMTLPSCFHLLESSPSSAVLNRSTPLTGGVLPWINPTIKTPQQYCSLCVKNILELALLTLFHTILAAMPKYSIFVLPGFLQLAFTSDQLELS